MTIAGLLCGSQIPGEADAHGQDPVRPADGSSAVDDVCPNRRTVRWRPLCQVVALRRAFPGYGICPADVSGEPEGHRGLSVGASLQALSYGFSRPDSARDAVRCERGARLAHVRRFRAGAHSSGQKTLRGREPRGGTLRDGLRARTRRPSTCACRSFLGRCSVRPRRP